MESNSTQVCRLCLEASDDLVNIFDEYQESTTIASILNKHFWFEVHKNDGLSECLCQICWTSTKTFHIFYKRVEQLQQDYWSSIRKDGETDCSDQMKEERDVPSEPDLDKVKCEERESKLEVIHIEISKDDDGSGYIDGNSCDQNNDVHISDCEDSNSNMKPSDSDDIGDNEYETQNVDCKSDNDDDDDFDGSQSTSRCKKDTAKEDAQIREFFSMVCEICNDNFETFIKARNHYRFVHNTAGYLTCCGKKFNRRGRVLDHIYRHLNPDAYRCDPCGKRFGDKFALKNHIENHEPFTSRAYKCGMCSSSFTKASKLAQHERIRHCSEEDKKFHCDKCNKNFVSKSVLGSHIRGVHEFAFAHVCDICARVFKSKHVFENHMQVEHSTTTRPKMQCNVCGAWLKHEDSLRKHLKRHQDTFANCPICNKVLQNKHSLGNHIRSVHGERTHQCTLCAKAFKKAIVLKEHMALHTGQDLYKCPYCTKTFKSGANMHAHRKKAHFEEWTRDRSKRFTPTSVE